MKFLNRLMMLWGTNYRKGSRNKFIFRPKANLNLLKFLVQRPFDPIKPDYKPITLMVEASTRCNLECPTCERALFKKQSILPVNQVTFLSIEKLRPMLPYVHSVYFSSGLGEPFLNPQFWQMHKIVKEYKINTGYFSNSVLWDENTIRKTFQEGVNAVLVSIDSQAPEKYELFKKGAKLGQTVQKLKLFSKIRSEYPGINFKLGLNYIQRADNYEEMPEFIEFAKRLGADYCFFTALIVHEEEHVNKSPYLIDPQKRKAVYEKVKERSRALKMAIRLPEIDIDPAVYSKTCNSAWRCLSIFENGDVCLCPFFRTPRDFYFHVDKGRLRQYKKHVDDIVIGNIHNQGILDIWNSEKAQKIRKAIKIGKNIPSPCDTCYYKYELH